MLIELLIILANYKVAIGEPLERHPLRVPFRLTILDEESVDADVRSECMTEENVFAPPYPSR